MYVACNRVAQNCSSLLIKSLKINTEAKRSRMLAWEGQRRNETLGFVLPLLAFRRDAVKPGISSPAPLVERLLVWVVLE